MTFKQPGESLEGVKVGEPSRKRKQQILRFQSRGGKQQIDLRYIL